MNERIKELAKESGIMDYTKIFVPEMEKFAELILQDIDKIVDDLYHALPFEKAVILLTLDENIKDHFYGVEE